MITEKDLSCGLTGMSGEIIRRFQDNLFSCLITSIPYNVGKNYGNGYNDKKPLDVYLDNIEKDFKKFKPKMKYDSLIFVNVGNRVAELMKSHLVAERLAKHFNFIQTITWVKSISIPVKDRWIEVEVEPGVIKKCKITQDYITPGHYTPISSDYRFHATNEYIFVFSPNPKVKFNRLAIGVPFEDKGNIGRYSDRDLKSRGDTWFIPYETTGRTKKKGHEAPFPLQLPEMCIAVSPEGPVLDPYAGLSTTARAAENLKRKYAMIEQNPECLKDGFERNNLKGRLL